MTNLINSNTWNHPNFIFSSNPTFNKSTMNIDSTFNVKIRVGRTWRFTQRHEDLPNEQGEVNYTCIHFCMIDNISLIT